MEKSKLSPKLKKQIKADSALLSAMLEDIIKLFNIASEQEFLIDYFSVTKKDFLNLWYDVLEICEKVDNIKSVPKSTPEKDVTE